MTGTTERSSLLSRLPLDRFSIAMVGMVALASVLPARGRFAEVLDVITTVGVAALFFLHGAKLSREDILSGITNWRLHLLVVALTYLAFPLAGMAMRPLGETPLLSPELVTGFLFLAALPSTVQSSISFTSIAKGNVPAAICAASLSNLIGVFATPLLVTLLISRSGEIALLDAILKIVLLILLPFVVGHLLRPKLGPRLQRWRERVNSVDRGVILLIAYAAFSESVVDGLWQQVSPGQIAGVLVASSLLLAFVMGVSTGLARLLGFNREDRITILFCGSKKSLASGMPMAKVLFAGMPTIGAIILPIILFHQIQLMVCAWLAERFSRSAPEPAVRS